MWSRSSRSIRIEAVCAHRSVLLGSTCVTAIGFKTWSKGSASTLLSLGFNRSLAHVTQTAQSLWRPPPPPSSPPLVYCSLFCSAFSGGLWKGGSCWTFCTVSERWPRSRVCCFQITFLKTLAREEQSFIWGNFKYVASFLWKVLENVKQLKMHGILFFLTFL